jgi:hypothetical protein
MVTRREVLGGAGAMGGFAFVGCSLMGTDHPSPWMKTAVDHILAMPGLSDAERAAMLGGTAAQLLGIGS